MPENIELHQLWAKLNPFQSVSTHGYITGVLAQTLFRQYFAQGTRQQLCDILKLTEDECASTIGYLAAIHDIGKIHPLFQQKDSVLYSKYKGIFKHCPDIPFRHELESRCALERLHGREMKLFAEILEAHHQGKPRNMLQVQYQTPPEWKALQEQYAAEMRAIFKPVLPIPKIQSKVNKSIVAINVLGLTILADWTASSELFVTAESWSPFEESIQKVANEFCIHAGLCYQQIDFGDTFCDMWHNIPKGAERELQKKVEDMFSTNQRYILTLIEAPMGEGKTEAGVYAASKMAKSFGKCGFYTALPTSATANQMVDRIRALIKDHTEDSAVRLLHSTAWMMDDVCTESDGIQSEDALYAQNWMAPLRRGMLAQYAVGTVDQAMTAAMFVKYGVIRLLGLTGKALIIDEVHAYTTYMNTILEDLLRWCKVLQVPVVLLSATLTDEKKQKLLSIYTDQPVGSVYPAITAVTESGNVEVIHIDKVAKTQTYRVETKDILNNPDHIAKHAMQKVKDGGCACVLMNTVMQAQEVYRSLKAGGFDGKLLLFHARFPAQRRAVIERQCIEWFGKDTTNRPEKAILVCTQVVEQSLDVDFDYMMSAIAPIDLLLQRMGRLFRHDKTPRPAGFRSPTFTVLTPYKGQFRADKAVYPECLLKQSIHLLTQRKTIEVPEDMQPLVNAGYSEDAVPQTELSAWYDNLVTEQLTGAMAEKYLLGSPEKHFRPLRESVEFDDLESQSYMSAQTRLSPPTVSIVLCDDMEAFCETHPNMTTESISPITNQPLSCRVYKPTVPEAKELLLQTVSVSVKRFQELERGEPIVYGDGLLRGIAIISVNNPVFALDAELGVVIQIP